MFLDLGFRVVDFGCRGVGVASPLLAGKEGVVKKTETTVPSKDEGRGFRVFRYEGAERKMKL